MKKTWKILSLVVAIMMVFAVAAMADTCAPGHDFEHGKLIVVEAATCEHGTIYAWKCANCDDTDPTYGGNGTYDNGKTVDHTPVAIADKKPTCTEVGYKDATVCAVCGEILSGELPTVEHEWKADWNDATCDGNGTIHLICTVCKAEKAEAYEGATGHDYKEVDGTRKAATCTTNGTYLGKCSKCGKEETIKFKDKLVHEWVLDEKKAPTCTDSGVDEAYCANGCGLKIIITDKVEVQKWLAYYPDATEKQLELWTKTAKANAAGHLFGTEYETVYPNCEHDGYIVVPCVKCSYKQVITPESNDPRVVHLKKTDHKFLPLKNENAVKLLTPATCTTDGEGVFRCTQEHGPDKIRCGYEVIKTIPAFKHNWTVWEIEHAANCEEDGARVRYCVTCMAKDFEILPKLGHKWVEDTANCVAATCLKDGVKSEYCDVCGKTQKTVVTGDHAWTEWKAVNETMEARNCAVCHEMEVRTIGAADPETPAESEKPEDTTKPAPTTKPSTPGSSGPSGNKPATSPSGVTIPATGDTSIAWVYMMMAAAVIVLAVAMKRRALNK